MSDQNQIERIINNILSEDPNLIKGRVSNAGVGQYLNVQTNQGTIRARNTNIISPQGDVNVVIGDNGENLVWGIENSTVHEDRSIRKTRDNLKIYPFKRFYTDLTSTLYKDGDGRGLVNLRYYGQDQAYALGGTNLGKDEFLALYFIQNYAYFVDRSQVYDNLGNPDTIIYLGNEYCKNGNVNNYANTNYNYGIDFNSLLNGQPLSYYPNEDLIRRNEGYILDWQLLAYRLFNNSEYLEEYKITGNNINENANYYWGIVGTTDNTLHINDYSITTNSTINTAIPISYNLLGKTNTYVMGSVNISETGTRQEAYHYRGTAKSEPVITNNRPNNPQYYSIITEYNCEDNYTDSENSSQVYSININYVFPDKTLTLNNSESCIRSISSDMALITTNKYPPNDPIENWYRLNKYNFMIHINNVPGSPSLLVEFVYEVNYNESRIYNYNYEYYDLLFVFDKNNYLFLKLELKGTVSTSCNVDYNNSLLVGVQTNRGNIPFETWVDTPVRGGFHGNLLLSNPNGTQSYTQTITKGKIEKYNIGNEYDFYIPHSPTRTLELTEIKIGTTDIFCDNDFFLIGRTPNVIDVNITNHSFDRFNQLYIGGQVSYYRLYQGLNEDWIINTDSFDGYFFADNKLCEATITFTVRLEPENEAFYVNACNVEITNVLDTYCFLSNLGIFEPIDFGYYVEYYAGIFSKNSLFCLMRMAAETPNYQFKPNMNTVMIKDKPMWYFTDINADKGQTRVDVYTVEDNRIIRKPNIKDTLIKAKKEPFIQTISYHPTK